MHPLKISPWLYFYPDNFKVEYCVRAVCTIMTYLYRHINEVPSLVCLLEYFISFVFTQSILFVVTNTIEGMRGIYGIHVLEECTCTREFCFEIQFILKSYCLARYYHRF